MSISNFKMLKYTSKNTCKRSIENADKSVWDDDLRRGAVHGDGELKPGAGRETGRPHQRVGEWLRTRPWG